MATDKKISASDGESGDYFGYSVAIDGDYLAVGAMAADAGDSGSGATYVFERRATGWQQVRRLTSSDAQRLGFFGSSVAISGDYLVVGAMAAAVESGTPDWWAGAAYVFERQASGRQHVRKLTPSGTHYEDWFGHSVAIDGTRLVVGAPGRGGQNVRYGAVFVFERANGIWHEVQKLAKSDAQYDDWFGYSVAISGSRVGVGTRDPNECYLFSPEI